MYYYNNSPWRSISLKKLEEAGCSLQQLRDFFKQHPFATYNNVKWEKDEVVSIRSKYLIDLLKQQYNVQFC